MQAVFSQHVPETVPVQQGRFTLSALLEFLIRHYRTAAAAEWREEYPLSGR